MKKKQGKLKDEYDGVLSLGAMSAKQATKVATILQEYEGVEVICVTCSGAHWFVFARYKSRRIEPLKLRNEVMMIEEKRKY